MLSIAWRIADTGAGDPGPWRRAFGDPTPVVTGLAPGTMVEVDLGNGVLWPGIVPGTPEPQIPEVITAPSITAGPHGLGAVIEGVAGTYSNAPTSIARRWMIRDAASAAWSQVADATGLSVSVTALMAGYDRIRLEEQPANAAGAAEWVDSNIAILDIQEEVEPPDIAPTILTPPVIEAQPLVGQPLVATPPEVGGNPAPHAAYQWYDGNPGAGGVPIEGWDSLEPTPTATQYGADLWLRVTAVNAAGSVHADVQAGVVGIRFREDFAAFTAGEGNAELLAKGWGMTSQGAFTGLFVEDPDAPAGRALQFTTTISNNHYAWPKAGDGFTRWAESGYIEELYLFRENDAGATRVALRARGISAPSSGVAFRNGVVRLQLPGEDTNNSVGTSMGVTTAAGQLYWVRHRIQGAVAKAKIWPFAAPEPTEWTESPQHGGPIPYASPSVLARVTGGTQRALYIGWAGNAPAPYPAGYEPLPQEFGGAMAFSKAAPQDSVAAFNGLIRFNLEDV